ncbi:MAG: hypothetical protein AAFO07_17985 [Bacteroidota bacterium]
MLRKAIIKEKISIYEYLVEDLFNQELLTMRLSGKQVMNYTQLELGKEIYLNPIPHESEVYRLITTTDMKMDDTNTLYTQKIELDKKQKELE